VQHDVLVPFAPPWSHASPASTLPLPHSEGVSAISWPMLTAESAAVATLVPVATAAAWMTSAPSSCTPLVFPPLPASYRSVIPPGAVKLLFPFAVLKRPTSIVFVTVGVIDGAVTLVDAAFGWALETLMGVVAWTPE
jgi:hypothetical protein